MRGVVYVAEGERHVRGATLSVASLRRVMPDVAVVVARGTVEGTQPLEVNEADAYRAKILALQRSPFDVTLLLDADTYVACDLSEIFDLLDDFDVCAAHSPNRGAMILPEIPWSFPEFNTGVIGLRRNDTTDRLLAEWLRLYDEMLPDRPPSWDQPSFRRAVYQASDLRVAVLPPEFNQRFEMSGFCGQSVRILHGWADTARYEQIAASLSAREGAANDWHVFAGLLVFDRNGRQIANYGPRFRRIRRALRFARRIVSRP